MPRLLYHLAFVQCPLKKSFESANVEAWCGLATQLGPTTPPSGLQIQSIKARAVRWLPFATTCSVSSHVAIVSALPNLSCFRLCLQTTARRPTCTRWQLQEGALCNGHGILQHRWTVEVRDPAKSRGVASRSGLQLISALVKLGSCCLQGATRGSSPF